jgi:tRNA-specific 2-thiouridylase
MDRFCKSYLCGLTPNPCIDCNRYLKFNALQKRRKELGFDYVATGHYARRIYNDQSLKYMLYRGKDVSKDQGYVLYHLDQDTLAHMLFPLGDLKKTEVRAIAEKAGFINAHKHESQDICFVPDGDYSSFIEQYYGAKSNEGSIVDTAGNILGSHNGIINYTVGQRRGLGIAAKEPLYVIKKDALTNSITVGFKDELFISRVIARDINLIDEDPWFEPRALQIKPNYRAGFSSAKVYCKTLSYEGCEEMCIIAELDKPIQACSPGQALVIYDGDHVVGGGTICEDIQ